jgi:AcrR family transcriptional regulator
MGAAVTGRSQAERTAATRARVLHATVAVLASHGYAGATTLKIQEVADVSRGRLLHLYSSRDALLIDAVQYLAAARFEELKAQATDIPTGERLRRGIQLLWLTHDGPMFWAAMELWLAARSHEELRKALVPAEQKLGQVIRDLADALFGEALTRSPMYAAWREELITSMRGVALAYAFERRELATDPHLSRWEQLGRRMLEGAV